MHRRQEQAQLQLQFQTKNEVLFFFVIFAVEVFSLGITSRNSADYYPGMDEDFTLCVRNSLNEEFPIDLEVEGTLKDYITLDENQLVLGPNEIVCLKYNVRIPDEVDFVGTQSSKIWAKQQDSSGSGVIQVLSNIHHKVSVRFPYPEKYVSFTVDSNDAEVGEPVVFDIEAKNLGEMDILSAYASLDIYGADDYSNFIKNVQTGKRPIASMQTESFTARLETDGLKPGYYKAKVDMFYDGESTDKDELFRIGTLLIRVTNYTESAIAGKINPFSIELESLWNNEIDGVTGQITFDDIQEKIDTKTISIKAWQKSTIDTFIDLRDDNAGEYIGRVRLEYGNKTTDTEIVLKVLEAKEAELAEEMPKSTGFSTSNLLILVLIALIILNIGYFLKKK